MQNVRAYRPGNQRGCIAACQACRHHSGGESAGPIVSCRLTAHGSRSAVLPGRRLPGPGINCSAPAPYEDTESGVAMGNCRRGYLTGASVHTMGVLDSRLYHLHGRKAEKQPQSRSSWTRLTPASKCAAWFGHTPKRGPGHWTGRRRKRFGVGAGGAHARVTPRRYPPTGASASRPPAPGARRDSRTLRTAYGLPSCHSPQDRRSG